MSEYATLYCGEYEIDSFRNGGLPPYLFTEEDKQQSSTPYLSDVDTPGYQYRNTARILIERLEVAGYSLQDAAEAYRLGAEQAIENLRPFENYDDWGEDFNDARKKMEDERARKIAFHEDVHFEEWRSLMGEIIRRNLETIYGFNEQERNAAQLECEAPNLLVMLNRKDLSWDYSYFGFMGGDLLAFYRAVFETVPPDTEIVLDYSDLVGWVDEYAYDVGPAPKIVILTEGSSDARILEASLGVRYPHLKEYYSFLDFEQFNIQGSAGQLLNMVRAFVGAGMAQRMVAIFDNDTAGHDAIRHLKTLELPPNIKAITLPDLKMALDYPTLGPQGDVNADINGRACSLELYLGEDILSQPNGELTPIQWSGYNTALKRYQGEILNKKEIQTAYLNILSKQNEVLEKHDWTAMDLIWQTVFKLFTS